MLIQRPTLKDIDQMRDLVSEEVRNGVILERSEDEMATAIRSYHIVRSSSLQKCQIKENLTIDSKNDPIIGFCALYIYSKDLGELRSLIVSERYRRKGVASALINSVKDEAKSLGLKDLLVLTYRAELFQRCGFAIIDKALLPNQKIWADCIKCKHFPICNEIALLAKL